MLPSRPSPVLQLGEPRGLVAFLFEAPLVEEVPSTSPWSPLRGGDHYPTVPVVLHAEGLTTLVLADLDTGSAASNR